MLQPVSQATGEKVSKLGKNIDCIMQGRLQRPAGGLVVRGGRGIAAKIQWEELYPLRQAFRQILDLKGKLLCDQGIDDG